MATTRSVTPFQKEDHHEYITLHRGRYCRANQIGHRIILGWYVAVKLLAALIVIDYVTGFLAAGKHKKINSDVMFWGGIRKGIIFLVIIVAVLADEMLNDTSTILRTLTISRERHYS